MMVVNAGIEAPSQSQNSIAAPSAVFTAIPAVLLRFVFWVLLLDFMLLDFELLGSGFRVSDCGLRVGSGFRVYRRDATAHMAVSPSVMTGIGTSCCTTPPTFTSSEIALSDAACSPDTVKETGGLCFGFWV